MKNIELAKSQQAARVLAFVLQTLDERTVYGLIESAWNQLRGEQPEHEDCRLHEIMLAQLLWLHREAGGWIEEEANEGGFLVNVRFVPTFEWVKKHGPLPPREDGLTLNITTHETNSTIYAGNLLWETISVQPGEVKFRDQSGRVVTVTVQGAKREEIASSAADNCFLRKAIEWWEREQHAKPDQPHPPTTTDTVCR